MKENRIKQSSRTNVEYLRQYSGTVTTVKIKVKFSLVRNMGLQPMGRLTTRPARVVALVSDPVDDFVALEMGSCPLYVAAWGGTSFP